MAIDEDTARALDDGLRRVLSEAGMGWVIEQIDETVAEGRYLVKPRKRGGQRLDVDAVEVVEKASDARRGEIGTRPFTARERLQMLIDAATTALTQTPELEEEIQREVIDKDPEVETLEFVDEDTRSVRRVLRRDRSPDARQARAGRAVEQLREFRRRISEDM